MSSCDTSAEIMSWTRWHTGIRVVKWYPTHADTLWYQWWSDILDTMTRWDTMVKWYAVEEDFTTHSLASVLLDVVFAGVIIQWFLVSSAHHVCMSVTTVLHLSNACSMCTQLPLLYHRLASVDLAGTEVPGVCIWPVSDLYLALHCHCQNDSASSGVGHLKAVLIVRSKISHRAAAINHSIQEKASPAESEPWPI